MRVGKRVGSVACGALRSMDRLLCVCGQGGGADTPVKVVLDALVAARGVGPPTPGVGVGPQEGAPSSAGSSAPGAGGGLITVAPTVSLQRGAQRAPGKADSDSDGAGHVYRAGSLTAGPASEGGPTGLDPDSPLSPGAASNPGAPSQSAQPGYAAPHRTSASLTTGTFLSVCFVGVGVRFGPVNAPFHSST
jgi:hypothetical protein